MGELPEPTAGPLPLATAALGQPEGWLFIRPSCVCPATQGVFLLPPPCSLWWTRMAGGGNLAFLV